MGPILIITDDAARAARLAKRIAASHPARVLDLDDPETASVRPTEPSPDAVVVDMGFRRSAPLAALKASLAALPTDIPTFWIVDGDSTGARLQAHALGARVIVPSSGLAGALSPPGGERGPAPAGIERDVAACGRSFARIMDLARDGRVDPGAVAEGAALVEGALRRADLRAWLDLVWRIDDATHRHCLLVAGFAAAFGAGLGFAPGDRRTLVEAALLHDVGKAAIPTAVLNKPGPLDADETARMRTHPAIGHAMVLGHGYTDDVLSAVRSHHEYLDGSGYPDGLPGSEIPDMVRLITICDVFAALVERRPYRAPLPWDEAYGILLSMSGRLDPDLVRAFLPIARHAGPAEARHDAP